MHLGQEAGSVSMTYRVCFLACDARQETEKPNQKQLCCFSESSTDPLLPSFLPSSVSSLHCKYSSLLSFSGSSQMAIFPRNPVLLFPSGHSARMCTQGVSLMTSLISLWWFVISRLASISRVQTVTQSSRDLSHFSSTKANLPQCPRENELP